MKRAVHWLCRWFGHREYIEEHIYWPTGMGYCRRCGANMKKESL